MDDAGEGDPVRVREMATSTPRRASSRRRSSAWWTRASRARDRGLLPHERAVARAGGHAGRAQVGYQVIGGTKFYERAEIKDAISTSVPRQPADGQAFTRIANSPRRGIGQTSLTRVLAHSNDTGLTPWEAARGEVPGPATRGAQGTLKFMTTMERLRERAEGGAPVASARTSCST